MRAAIAVWGLLGPTFVMAACGGGSGGDVKDGGASGDASTTQEAGVSGMDATVTETGAPGDGSSPADGASPADGSSPADGASPAEGREAGASLPTKMDILLVIDDGSRSLPEESLLAQVVPQLLGGLLNPACVDASGTAVTAAMQPAPTGTCASGTHRAFPVITDAHVGVISSSLGTFGADGCPDNLVPASCTDGGVDAGAVGGATPNDDHGHLLSKADPCGVSAVPTYQGGGFLAWDPTSSLVPPGTAQLQANDGTGLADALSRIIVGTGNLGCGFRSQNEAWYRFLVDPQPYQSIALNGGQTATTSGTDSALLAQRSAFLRPDSLLLIVQVSTKPDTSIKEYSSFPLFAQEQQIENGQPFHLPLARSECTTKGPTDPCCSSCGLPTPPCCPAEPSCTSGGVYTNANENIALRAFGLTSHKARYGIEFFYQPSRYVAALTSPTVEDEVTGAPATNPIFAGGRRPNDVLYATITGVPWQLIARQANGVPDLVAGADDLDSTKVGGFKTFAELSEKDSRGNTFWDDIAGDPENYVAPISPIMQESTSPRTGTDPITGVAIAAPGAPAGANPINGSDFIIATPPGDIEYACIFPAVTPIDCSASGTSSSYCDCTLAVQLPSDDAGVSDDAGDSGVASNPNVPPLCSPNPNDRNNLTLQTAFKAYPGLKHLAIAKGLGDRGIVASACPAQQTNSSRADFGYLPAVKAIVDRVKIALTSQGGSSSSGIDAGASGSSGSGTTSGSGASSSSGCPGSSSSGAGSPSGSTGVGSSGAGW